MSINPLRVFLYLGEKIPRRIPLTTIKTKVNILTIIKYGQTDEKLFGPSMKAHLVQIL